jgi:hypothetical protein
VKNNKTDTRLSYKSSICIENRQRPTRSRLTFDIVRCADTRQIEDADLFVNRMFSVANWLHLRFAPIPQANERNSDAHLNYVDLRGWTTFLPLKPQDADAIASSII